MMTEVVRKLASVRKIVAIDPIEGADNIVCATVDGWKLVTQKSNNFQPGDLVVYFEIDSFLPICERFEFLRSSSYRKMGDEEGFRIKTIKLRGQVSQGLILPISEVLGGLKDRFWQCEHSANQSHNWMVLASHGGGYVKEGLDLTELLGVKKWDPPLPANLAGKARGNFPSFIPKTDQERVQNLRRVPRGVPFEVTLKLDGSSMTVYRKSGYFGVCSRNLDLEETEGNSFWQCARQSGLFEALEKLEIDNVAFQGELMGPGVQGNREQLKQLEFYLFDVWLIEEQKYLAPNLRQLLFEALKTAGAKIKHAPIVDESFRIPHEWETEDLLAMADRPSLTHAIAEGIVFKHEDFSFKVINNKFLLKEKD